MSDAWPFLATNLATIVDAMSPEEFVKQPRLLETMDGTARTLVAAEFYKRMMTAPGGVAVLGVRWGADLMTMIRLRHLFEPHNQLRPIVGFDTFAGHVGSGEYDGDVDIAQEGALSVTENWDQILAELVESMLRLDIGVSTTVAFVKGDARERVPVFVEENPAFMVAGVIVDFDLYEPTLASLLALTPRMSPGTVLWFDELTASNYPGESRACREWVAETGVRLEYWRPSWAVHEQMATVKGFA